MPDHAAVTLPQPWDKLHDDEGDTGTSYVLPSPPPGIDDLLAHMIEDQYGGGASEVDRSHPEFVSCLTGVVIEMWRQFSVPAAETFGTEPGYWGAGGDSDHSILVGWFDGDVYDLGVAIYEAGSDRQGASRG